jgi:hypothetical protein
MVVSGSDGCIVVSGPDGSIEVSGSEGVMVVSGSEGRTVESGSEVRMAETRLGWVFFFFKWLEVVWEGWSSSLTSAWTSGMQPFRRVSNSIKVALFFRA